MDARANAGYRPHPADVVSDSILHTKLSLDVG
jgi:hypothetical protein